MTNKKKVEFLKFLHKLEARESANGLFTTDSEMLVLEIRNKFVSLNIKNKKKTRKG